MSQLAVATAVKQARWNAEPNDPDFIKPHSPVWLVSENGISGPYTCVDANERKLYDPFFNEQIHAGHYDIPLIPMDGITNQIQKHYRNGMRTRSESCSALNFLKEV